MKTDYIELVPIAGQQSVSSHKIWKRKPLLVERSGTSYDIILGVIPTPGSRQVDYISVFGILRFDQPFNAGETVKFWYKL